MEKTNNNNNLCVFSIKSLLDNRLLPLRHVWLFLFGALPSVLVLPPLGLPDDAVFTCSPGKNLRNSMNELFCLPVNGLGHVPMFDDAPYLRVVLICFAQFLAVFQGSFLAWNQLQIIGNKTKNSPVQVSPMRSPSTAAHSCRHCPRARICCRMTTAPRGRIAFGECGKPLCGKNLYL